MGQYDDNNQGYPPPSGGRSRFIMAIIIALLGLFTYLSQTEENPITGRQQHVSITPAQEIRLGLESAPTMAHEMGGETPSTDPRTKVVKFVGDSIIHRSKAHKGPWQFQFHLLNDPKVLNAFALPGGQIFITLGLFNKLTTEAQLAGVLSHEAGHVIQRHAAQQMAKGSLGQTLVLATGVGTSGSEGGNSAMMIANMVNQLIQLKYSRGDELEADDWGLVLMSEAGYTPKAMLEVMEILKKESGGGHTPEMLATHPYPESRIEKINAFLQKYPPSGNLTEGRNLKDMIQQVDRY